LLPELHRSDRWPALVRPVTSIRPVDRAGQAGGYNSLTTNVLESLSDFSRPWNKNTLKTQPARKKNPTPRQPKHLRNCQELTSANTTQRHMDSATHPRKIPQRAHTNQTGVTYAARDEQNPRVISSKSNSRSPDSLHGFEQDFGDSRNTSWALLSYGPPGPTTSVGTRTDYSACATWHLMVWGARTTSEEYSNRKLYMSRAV
jgi:hypothetical protein